MDYCSGLSMASWVGVEVTHHDQSLHSDIEQNLRKKKKQQTSSAKAQRLATKFVGDNRDRVTNSIFILQGFAY